MLIDFLCNLLSSNIHSDDHIAYRRVILVNGIILLSILVLLFFTCCNISMQQYLFAIFDILMAGLLLGVLIYLRVTKHIVPAALFATILLALFFIVLFYMTKGVHLGAIWTIFLPLFAIVVNGKKVGLYISIIFYTLVLSMAYWGIGSWESAQWLSIDFLRLSSASIVLTFIVYFNEFALERSDIKLHEVRQREQEYLKRLEKQAITDGLTSLYNRRHFEDLAPKLLSLAKRKNLFFTFFIIDVDHFKSYNDNYGHQAGDKALIQVAAIIKQHIQRDDDFVFRLGGDEFAGIALSDTHEYIEKHINNICAMVEKVQIDHRYSDNTDYLTTSIGMITISPDQDATIDTLYQAADKNLYKAKQNGKHQCVASQLETTA